MQQSTVKLVSIGPDVTNCKALPIKYQPTRRRRGLGFGGWDIDPARVMRPRFADSIRASHPDCVNRPDI